MNKSINDCACILILSVSILLPSCSFEKEVEIANDSPANITSNKADSLPAFLTCGTVLKQDDLAKQIVTYCSNTEKLKTVSVLKNCLNSENHIKIMATPDNEIDIPVREIAFAVLEYITGACFLNSDANVKLIISYRDKKDELYRFHIVELDKEKIIRIKHSLEIWETGFMEGKQLKIHRKDITMATHIKAPSIVKAAGTKPKQIEEFIGMVNSKTEALSIARMKSPEGWEEPGQTPDFDEYTVVLKGSLSIETSNGVFEVREGEAFIAEKGEWVRYSTPFEGGAEYIAVCLPAFAPGIVHRDK